MRTAPVNHTIIDGQVTSLSALNAELTELFADAIFVPNSMVPADMHNNKEWNLGDASMDEYKCTSDRKTYGQSAASLSRKFDAKYGEKIEKADRKAEKEARLARYAEQVNSGEEIDYDVNEDALYKFELAFVGARVNAGLDTITEEQ